MTCGQAPADAGHQCYVMNVLVSLLTALLTSARAFPETLVPKGRSLTVSSGVKLWNLGLEESGGMERVDQSPVFRHRRMLEILSRRQEH